MLGALIYLDTESPMNLQNQIRQKLVDGILNGAFPPGMKPPSSRSLASQLEVARNTVVAVYQQLIADGCLVSRQHSGVFVNEEMLETRVGYSGASLPPRASMGNDVRRVDLAGRHFGDFAFFKEANMTVLGAPHRSHL